MEIISRKFRENRCVSYEYAHVLDKIGCMIGVCDTPLQNIRSLLPNNNIIQN